jgi:hypothetical protein
VAYFRFRELRDYRLPFGSTDAGKHLSFQWSRLGQVRSNGVNITSEPLPGCIGAGLEAGIPVYPVIELAKYRQSFGPGPYTKLRQSKAFREACGTGRRWASRRQVRNLLRSSEGTSLLML